MKEITVFIVLLEKESVSDKDFTFPFILLLLLLLLDNPFPSTGGMNIEANSRSCNETRIIVIVFIFEVCINSMP